MGKCRKCGKELTGIETTGWFGKLCEKCWQEQHYTQYPFKKGIDEKDKKIADLEAKLAEKDQAIDKRNEEISNLQRVKNNLSRENHNLIKKNKTQRNELIEEIRKKAFEKQFCYDTEYDYELGSTDEWAVNLDVLFEILDQLKGKGEK